MISSEERTWHLYVLRCADQTLYTGITTDVAVRLVKHGNGTASKYTRSRRPVTLVHQEACESKSKALKKERSLKEMSRKEKEAYITCQWTKRP